MLSQIAISGSTITLEMVISLKAIKGLTDLIIDTDWGNPETAGWGDPSLGVRLYAGPTTPESILLLRDLPKLERIWMRGVTHNDSLVPALSQLGFLKRLQVTGTSISPAGLDQLRRALPGCNIWK